MPEARRYCPDCDRQVLARKPPAASSTAFLLVLLTCGLFTPLLILLVLCSALTPLRCPQCGHATSAIWFGGPTRAARRRRQDQRELADDEAEYRQAMIDLARRARSLPPAGPAALPEAGRDEQRPALPPVSQQSLAERLAPAAERTARSLRAGGVWLATSPPGVWSRENPAAAWTIAVMWAGGLSLLGVLAVRR